MEVQKNHIVDGINDAVGIQFSPDNIVCVSGQMALCARQLCVTQNEHVIRDAEDYLRYSPEFSGPMGQDSKINDKDFPTIAKFLQKNSGILEFEKWYVYTSYKIKIRLSFLFSAHKQVVTMFICVNTPSSTLFRDIICNRKNVVCFDHIYSPSSFIYCQLFIEC